MSHNTWEVKFAALCSEKWEGVANTMPCKRKSLKTQICTLILQEFYVFLGRVQK